MVNLLTKAMKALRRLRIFDVILFAALAWTLWNTGPRVLANFKAEGKMAGAFSAPVLTGGEFRLSDHKDKLVLVFWATWCGPCEWELKRIKQLIDENKISARNVLAVSSFEDPRVVAAAAKEREYPFPVAADPAGELRRLYNVEVTPTMLFIAPGGKVEYRTSGVSPLLEFRLKGFLGDLAR